MDLLPFNTQEEFTFLCKRIASYFNFLNRFGFNIVAETWPRGNSFKDGFQIIYSKPYLKVIIQYYDMEFDVRFETQNETISFYFIDREFFQNQSGFQGSMFPRNKIQNAAKVIANEIDSNYYRILDLDEQK